MMMEILKVIIFILFSPTFLKTEVLVRCLQTVTSRCHLFFANSRWEQSRHSGKRRGDRWGGGGGREQRLHL